MNTKKVASSLPNSPVVVVVFFLTLWDGRRLKMYDFTAGFTYTVSIAAAFCFASKHIQTNRS